MRESFSLSVLRAPAPALAGGLRYLIAIGLSATASFAERAPAGIAPQTPLGDLVITAWSTGDGLPAKALTNALQTADGYLWLASFDGLMRFDGREFTLFDGRTTPALGVSGLYELVETRGELWLGTQGAGVAVYRNGRFERLAGGAERWTVRTILIDDAGVPWIGTAEHGAHHYQDGRWHAVEQSGLGEATVRDILQDRRGALWLATEGEGLIRLEGEKATSYTEESGLVSDAVTSLCEAADGSLWVGTQSGLSRLDGGTIETYVELAGIEIYRIYLDDFENLWLAAEQGLIRRSAISGEFERFESLGGYSLRSLSAIVFGREGEVWLASYLDGLYQLKASAFRRYTGADGLVTQRVNAIYETPERGYLIAGDGGRIGLVRGDDVGELEIGERLPDVRVRGILQDRRGRLWIASYAGLLEISDRRRTWHTTDTGLPSNQVRLVFEDRAGRIWVGTRNAGLVEVLEGGGFRVLDKTSGLSSNFVLSIAEGPAGERLVGTYEGLSVVHPDGTVATYGVSDGLPGGLVFSAFVDDLGAVWLPTSGGLARLHRGEIRAITVDQGLPAESVFDYREDGRGSAWLSSSIGAIQVSKEQLLAVLDGARSEIEAIVYDERDGMSTRDCTGAAKILQASDGRLWFPTLGGVSVIDPGDIPVNRVAPPVEISRFAVDGEPIALHGPGHKIELGPGKKDFAFRFAALSFLAPSKVTVRYRLEGFDDGWVEALDERSVRYTNLAPGDYEFRVIAANNDGVWNEEGAKLDFRVAPYLHERPLFLVVLALLVLAAGRGVHRWRMRAVEARQAHLEGIIARQRAAEQARQRLIEELETKNAELERFAYTVSHDLKSPLVTIRGFLGMLERDLEQGDGERVRNDVARIHSAAGRMGQLLEELLELSRIGRLVKPPEKVALRELAAGACDLLSGAVEERGAEIEIASDLPTVSGDRARLLEVYQNLIENAVKYTGDNATPRIEVGWRRDDERVVFFVRDNGIGIEPRYHEKVFGLFERLDAAAEGTGVGLALAKRIVELHGGRIWVESEGKGRGSTFCFTLPGAPDAARALGEPSAR